MLIRSGCKLGMYVGSSLGGMVAPHTRHYLTCVNDTSLAPYLKGTTLLVPIMTVWL